MRPSSVVAASGFVGFFVALDGASVLGFDDFEATFGVEPAAFLGFVEGAFVEGAFVEGAFVEGAFVEAAARRRLVGSRASPFFDGGFGDPPVAVTGSPRWPFRENE
ncbi:MAG: hypothetical protein H6722_10585 [Sandaracinus sp.]|nr:hypothetical protein [Sandaracinus sp.]MCB9612886.1 hypothetical protein [Sandaracinus sp.]MCB9623131.1 hypothetical protein [Sandaracinus sp.]